MASTVVEAKKTPKPLPYKIPQPIISGPTVTSQPVEPPLPVGSPGTTVAQRVAVLSSGQYLQLGAFGSFEAAGEMLGRVRDALPVEVFVFKKSDSELYKVQAGPFDSPATLTAARQTLREGYSIDAIPMQRTNPGARCC